jgi:hypothetical protein
MGLKTNTARQADTFEVIHLTFFTHKYSNHLGMPASMLEEYVSCF